MQVVEEFEKYDSVDGETVTSAAHHLFTVNPDTDKLNNELS